MRPVYNSSKIKGFRRGHVEEFVNDDQISILKEELHEFGWGKAGTDRDGWLLGCYT